MSAPARIGPEAPASLPRLRSDLKLELIEGAESTRPVSIVIDPVRNTYFRLAWPHSGMLLLWEEAATADDMVVLMRSRYGAQIAPETVADMVRFAVDNQLTASDGKGGWSGYAAAQRAGHKGLAKTLMHNYLFFRIPLVHPDAALRRMLPWLSFVFGRGFWIAIAALAALDLYLVSRQWDAVAAAAVRSLQVEGLVIYAAAALAMKAIHELGHGLTTARYGCQVSSMGVAFILGAPVLYTDTSDSWRLSDRRQRLAIVLAGVAAEAIVATFALLAWTLLPDGLGRDVCFGLATVAIVLTLTVNLNPLMRFDGYFALSDYLAIPNLQARGFALGAWRLREALFGLGAPPPELLPARTTRILLVYAYATWIYRFFLFLGIALFVYVMAGKALGIVLAAFELIIFIFLPIYRELRTWWGLRREIVPGRRAFASAAGVVAVLAGGLVPWIASVESPAVLVAAEEQEIHLPVAAMITRIAVTDGERVAAGQVLVEARSPEVEHRLEKAKLEIRLLEVQLGRLIASDQERAEAVVLESRLRLKREEAQSLLRQRAQLTVTAPFAGEVTDLDRDLAPGTWVQPQAILARIKGVGAAAIKALLADTDLARVKPGAKGVFVADEAHLAARAVALTAIAPASDGQLTEAVLADTQGGIVAAAMEEGAIRTRHGWFNLSFAADGPVPARVVRGIVRVDAEPVSPLTLLWRQVGRTLVREQGF